MKTFAITSLLGMALAAPAPVPVETPPPQPVCGGAVSEWTVKDFDFHASYIFTNPAHQVSTGYANFTLINKVLDYEATCTATSTWLDLFFYGNVVYNCDVPAEGDVASFTYSFPSGALQINQTWHCPEQGSYYIAQGGTTLDLGCNTTSWTNPNWQQGQTYSTRFITCAYATVDAPITEIRGVA
jgi:hypothetical protein